MVDDSGIPSDAVTSNTLTSDAVTSNTLTSDAVTSNTMISDATSGTGQTEMTREEFEDHYRNTGGHPFALELLSFTGFRSAKLDFERFLNDEIIERLSEEERSVLLFISVFRLPLDMSALLESIPDREASRTHVESLIQKNLIRTRGDVISLHSLVTDLAASHISHETRGTFHLAAARYYEKLITNMQEDWVESRIVRSPGNPGWRNEHGLVIERIHHLLHANAYDEVIPLVVENADEFISCGYGEFYDVLRNLDQEKVGEELREDLLEILGDAHAEFGRLDEAFESYRLKLEKLEEAREKAQGKARENEVEGTGKEKGKTEGKLEGKEKTEGTGKKKGKVNGKEKTEGTGEGKGEGSLDEARMLHKLGEVERKKGDLDSAMEYGRRSLHIFQKRKSYRDSAKIYNELGLDHWKKGELEKATDSFQKAVRQLRRSGQKHALSRVLLNLAELEAEAGKIDRSDRYLGESLDAATSDGERIEILHLSGDLSMKKGEKDRAAESYTRGMELARKEKAFMELMYFAGRIGDIYVEQDRAAEAASTIAAGVDFIEKETQNLERKSLMSHYVILPLETLQSLSGRKKKGKAFGHAGNTGKAPEGEQVISSGPGKFSGKQEEIREYNYIFASLCEKAAGLMRDSGETGRIGHYLGNAAEVYRGFGDNGRAAALYLETGQAHVDGGDPGKASLAYRKAYSLFRNESNNKGCAISLLNLAGLLERYGDGKKNSREKLQLYGKALALSERAGFEKGLEIARKRLEELGQGPG